MLSTNANQDSNEIWGEEGELDKPTEKFIFKTRRINKHYKNMQGIRKLL